MIKDFLLAEIKQALANACKENIVGQMTSADNVTLVIEKPKNPEFGDFAVNVSSLAREAKIAPPMIANAILEFLSSDEYTVSVMAGFINFKISDKTLAKSLKEILDKKSEYGRPEKIEKEKILLEYVSANPTGPFHIGHGR